MEQSVLRPSEKTTLLAGVMLLALMLRVGAVVVWWDDLGLDPDAYRGLAERLAEGRGLVTPEGRPTAFRPPLYPLMLASVLWAGAIGIAALHVTLGVATTGVTLLIGDRLGLSRWSVVAAGVVAVDPLLLRYTPQVMTEVTCAFWSAMLLWLAAGWKSNGRWPLGTMLLLGIGFGIATLSRPTFWVFGALGAVAWLVLLFVDGHEGRLRRLKHGTIVALAAIAVVLPWGLRNYSELGRPIITTTHGGYTLLLANNPVFWEEVVENPDSDYWRGESLDAWQRRLEVQMRAADVEPTDELARDRWFQWRATENIRANPDRFLRAAVFRLARLYDLSPAGGDGNRTAPLIVLGSCLFYAAIFTLALAGTVGLIGRRLRRGGSESSIQFRRWMPALLMICAYSSVHAVYWTDTRMRAPLVPAIALLTALGSSLVYGQLRRKASHANSPKVEPEGS